MSQSQPTKIEVRIALAVTALMLIGSLVAQKSQAWRFDFGQDYSAGWIVRQGNGPKLYDLHEQARVQSLVLNREGLLPFMHPPFEALIFAPLARFSYFHAYLIWGLINISLWFYFI